MHTKFANLSQRNKNTSSLHTKSRVNKMHTTMTVWICHECSELSAVLYKEFLFLKSMTLQQNNNETWEMAKKTNVSWVCVCSNLDSPNSCYLLNYFIQHPINLLQDIPVTCYRLYRHGYSGHKDSATRSYRLCDVLVFTSLRLQQSQE